jgi:dTMP kinase
MKNKSLFIVFEGIDGSGTTTQSKILKKWLVKKGYKVHLTAEPSDNFIGNTIRQILKKRVIPSADSLSPEIDHKTIALLFAADRLDHIQNEIAPLLKNNHIVISDRYTISSIVYQGEYTKDKKWIETINKYALIPDITFFIDIDGDIAFERISKRELALEIFEKKSKLIKLSQKYRNVIKKQKNIVTIDGTQSIEDIAKTIKKRLDNI